jgi:hypothetical protein
MDRQTCMSKWYVMGAVAGSRRKCGWSASTVVQFEVLEDADGWEG